MEPIKDAEHGDQSVHQDVPAPDVRKLVEENTLKLSGAEARGESLRQNDDRAEGAGDTRRSGIRTLEEIDASAYFQEGPRPLHYPEDTRVMYGDGAGNDPRNDGPRAKGPDAGKHGARDPDREEDD